LSQSDKNIGLVVGSILIAAMAFAIWVSIRNYRDRLKKDDRVQNLATEIYKSRIGVSTEDEANETNDSEGGNKP
jgi:membrane protein implicated in regulation of membrane protease activity